MKKIFLAIAGGAALSISGIAFAGSTSPAGAMQAVGSSINAGTHQGTALPLSQSEKSFVEVVNVDGLERAKVYDECLSSEEACGAKVVSASNEHGGVTLEVVDPKLGRVHVATDAQGFVVSMTRVGA